MPTYVLLQRAENFGAGAMLAAGSAGAKSQRAAVKALGGKVKAQYAVLGRFDAVLVVELPDAETALALSLKGADEGFYTEVLPAFEPADLDVARERLSPLLVSDGDDAG